MAFDVRAKAELLTRVKSLKDLLRELLTQGLDRRKFNVSVKPSNRFNARFVSNLNMF